MKNAIFALIVVLFASFSYWRIHKVQALTVLINDRDPESFAFVQAANTEPECTGITISWMKKEYSQIPINQLPSSYLTISQPAPISEPDKFDAYLYVKGTQPHAVAFREHGIGNVTKKLCFAMKGGGAVVDLIE